MGAEYENDQYRGRTVKLRTRDGREALVAIVSATTDRFDGVTVEDGRATPRRSFPRPEWQAVAR